MIFFRFLVGAALVTLPAQAQDITVPQPPPAIRYSPTNASAPAKELFGRLTKAAGTPSHAQSIGFYSRGCLSGAIALPITGPHWQVMRLSRNRNWAHPALIRLVQDFAARVPQVSSWQGILAGDMSQPRGGPMLTGHASHQIGLDADIWLTPMPPRVLTVEERETLMATNVVAEDWNDVNPALWTLDHLKVLKLAAQMPAVERLLVNPAIKKALCREAGNDRAWLSKVRPVLGHNYHFHLRMACPAGSPNCRPQDPPPRDDGCGAALDWWFSAEARRPKPPKPPAPPVTLAQLPNACRAVIAAP
jgi:penicillin-insensitive murein DD-endopeptidase